MRANKTNIYHTVFVFDGYYQSIIISFDIKNNPVIRYEAGITIVCFYLCW